MGLSIIQTLTKHNSVLCSALLVLLQDSLVTTAGPPMFSELVMKVSGVIILHLTSADPAVH